MVECMGEAECQARQKECKRLQKGFASKGYLWYKMVTPSRMVDLVKHERTNHARRQIEQAFSKIARR